MTSEENKRFYQQMMEAQNHLTADNIDSFISMYYAPDFIQHNLGPQGKELDMATMRQMAQQWVQDYQEFITTLDDIIAEGDRVVIRGASTATKRATGEREDWVFFCTARMSGGKVAEEWQLAVPVSEKNS